MTRIRLRDFPSDEELARLYPEPHDHRRWHDHELRVAATVAIGRWLGPWDKIADLSCGNAAIPDGIASPGTTLYRGDFAPGYEYQGPLETTLDMIPHVNLYVCSETIEHLRDPDAVLAKLRTKTEVLLLSTPIAETKPTDNPEHVWGWDVDDVGLMLDRARFSTTLARFEVVLPAWRYDYQIWAVR